MKRIFSNARPENPDLCKRCQHKASIPLQAGSWEIHLGSSHQILDYSRWAILKMTPLSGSEGLSAKETLPNPDSPEAFNQVQSWLSTCLSEHSCLSSGSVPLPTRVIDLDSPNLAKPRLHVPPPGSLGQYAALSYCWGSSPPFTTSSANLEERMRGFRLSELPATIRDAVRVARALGMKYLWVDALCIIQGTDEHALADWKRESAHMEDVYGNAHVTIVAAASRHCNAGMLNVSSPS
ncbi:HET-domain-containing protein [Pyrenochaeta sp. DS3sAY3a]|nr:HET-domain-containing protein [Pyrenochaeta sp. DS3sAY3a]